MDANNEQSELDPYTSYFSLPVTFLTAGIVVLLYNFWREASHDALRKKINAPSAKAWPVIGNLLDVRKFNGVHLLLCEYIKKYGKVFSFSMGAKPIVVIADPDILKQILVKDFWNFRNRFMQLKPKGAIAKSVFLACDEDWKRVRTTLTPTFSAKKMKGMVSMIEESFDRLMEKIETVVDTGMWDFGCTSFPLYV